MNAAQYKTALQEALQNLDTNASNKLTALIEKTLQADRMIYVFGNGGSGANASHFVQDLLKCPIKDFSSSAGRFKAICLNDNIPALSAYANDLGFEEVFKQQLMNFCQMGDLVIGVSGSGKSKNVIKAIEYANQTGADTFAITGFDGGELLKIAKQSVHIKTNNMQIYEDLSLVVFHSVITELKDAK